MSKLNILSIDGGGSDALVALELIILLHHYTSCLKKVDQIVACGFSSIFAAAIAMELNLKQVMHCLFLNEPEKFFTPNPKRDWFGLECKYIHQGLEQKIDQLFTMANLDPDTTLFHQLKKPLILLGCQLQEKQKQWTTQIFSTIDSPITTVKEAILKTSSIPMLFPSYKAGMYRAVDCINPSSVAISCAVRSGKALQEISVLSIGKGYYPHGVYLSHTMSWGAFSWVNPFLWNNSSTPSLPFFTLERESSVYLHEQIAKNFLQDRLLRLNPELPIEIQEDEYQANAFLREFVHALPERNSQEWKEAITWCSNW